MLTRILAAWLLLTGVAFGQALQSPLGPQGQGAAAPVPAGSIAVGTTAITGGTSGRVLFDNGGFVGEYTAAQLTAQINAATSSLSGALPAFPGTTSTFFRGDGTYQTLNCAALSNAGTGCSAAAGITALTSDVTATGPGSAAATIANAAVTYAKIQNLGALAIMGRSANSSGVGADIQATAASDGVLRESGSTVGFGTIATGGIANNAVTLAKLATQATNTVLGNATSGAAVPTALAVGSCSTASSALNWTTNTGFGCNTSITANAVAVGGITGLGTNVGTFLAANLTVSGALKVSSGTPTQAASTDLSDTTAATTWTVADASGATLSFTSITGSFSKINKTCVGGFRATYPSTANGSLAQVSLPCTAATGYTGSIGMCWTNINGANNLMVLNASANTATAFFQNNAATSANPVNSALSTGVVSCSFSFITT